MSTQTQELNSRHTLIGLVFVIMVVLSLGKIGWDKAHDTAISDAQNTLDACKAEIAEIKAKYLKKHGKPWIAE